MAAPQPAPAPLPPTLAWRGDVNGHLDLLDQTRLPHERVVLSLDRAAGVIEAIVQLRVRGAPAIGVAAAYGLVLGVREQAPEGAAFADVAQRVAAALAAARPTAVNLQWALDRCLAAAQREPGVATLLAEAQRIHADEVQMSERIGRAGA